MKAHHHGDVVCCARMPDTLNGSPESLIEQAVDGASKITGAWADTLAKSVDGATSPEDAYERLTAAAESLNLDRFAKIVERKTMQGVMLGALDSQWERENDEEIKLETFTTGLANAQQFLMSAADGGPAGPFRVHEQPFDRMVRYFHSRAVLTRAEFDKLGAAAKRRAFTIARMASTEMLETAHAEITRMIEIGRDAMVTGEGPSLRGFRKFVAERLESAGWTPANKSHVETIYRTNVLGAYGAGRKAEMYQPTVLKHRPYGQWRAVKDSRAREEHRAADGVILPLASPFWQRAWPPAGYNCRCRVVSRSKGWVDRRGKQIGPEPSGLPDPGFNSTKVPPLVD